MGKASIREALTQLTYARLVAPRSGSGYRVVPITLSGARDLFDLWRAIEGHAAAMAVERGIPASMMDRLENPDWSQLELEQSDPEFEAQRTVVFHFLVSTAGKSTRLTIAFSEMVIELERLLRFCLRLGLPGDQLAGGEADLVKALGGRKPELARAAAVKAVDGVQTLVLGSLVNSDAVLGMNLADLI
jgi:DNA-binding GntR family transcriptional regulator